MNIQDAELTAAQQSVDPNTAPKVNQPSGLPSQPGSHPSSGHATDSLFTQKEAESNTEKSAQQKKVSLTSNQDS